MKVAVKFEIEKEDVTQAYSGTASDCACGCSGRYYKQGEKSLEKIVDRLNANQEDVKIFNGIDNEIIFELEYDEVFCVRAYVNTDNMKYATLIQLLELAKR